jgi:hypothetical protein
MEFLLKRGKNLTVKFLAVYPIMKNLNMARALLLCCLFPAFALLQGCVPVASGFISYESAVSHQEHAAYTEYLFAAQAENESLQQAGKPPLPIAPEKEWRKNVYRLRLEYADYYTRQTSSNAPAHSFEMWKEIDRPLAEKAQMQQELSPKQR